MKRIVLICVFLFIFALPAYAEDNPYSEQYEKSGADGLKYHLSPSAQEYFQKENIDPQDPNWVNNLSVESIFSQVAQFLKTGGSEPFKSAVQMTGIIVVYAAARLFDRIAPYKKVISYIFVLIIAVGIMLPLFSLISAVSNALKGSATFMTAFLPVYAGILTVGGRGLTASGMSFMLLFAAEAVNLIASFVILPLMGSYLGMGLVSGIMPSGSGVGLGETIKKGATWLFSLALTIFLGLLSIQTAVNTAADSAGLKTVKFVLGSIVPVTGGALSESLSTLTASMKLLGSSVGMYGVCALALGVLPVVLELLLWRISLFFVSAAAELFGITEGVGLFKCVDSVLATLLGIMLFSSSLFIISLAVVVNS